MNKKRLRPSKAFIRKLHILAFTIILLGCAKKNNKVELIDCSRWEGFEVLNNCSCGYIEVPENHNEPNGKKIKIAFALKLGDNDNGYMPTIILTGGPGGPALDNINRFEIDSLHSIGDVILVDQRGMGRSSPLKDIGMETLDILAADLTQEEEKGQMAKSMLKYKNLLKEKGIDTRNYNTNQSAKDFGILMDKLGYGKYNLWGASYGTKLGAYILKNFPERIHAAVFSGPAGLDNKALEKRFTDFLGALEKVFGTCSKTPSCSKEHGKLKTSLMQVLNKLKTKPITVRLAEREFIMNAQDAVFFVRYMLYKKNAVELLKAFLKGVEEGDVDVIEQTCGEALSVFYGINISTFYSFSAYEEYNESTLMEIDSIVDGSEVLATANLGWFQSFIPSLGKWHKGRASSEEKDLGIIDGVPTLIVANKYDPATPPENSRFFKDAITDCQVLEFDIHGHVVFNDCVSTIRREFLKNPKMEIDSSCADKGL